MENRIKRARRSLLVLGCIIVAVALLGLGYALYGHFAEGRRLSIAMVLTFVATAMSGVCLVVSVVRYPPETGTYGQEGKDRSSDKKGKTRK